MERVGPLSNAAVPEWRSVFRFGTSEVAIWSKFNGRVEICRDIFELWRVMNEFSLDLARLSASVAFPLPHA
jgi:hypothetical protein